jgi:anti-anti-sigma factor
LIVFRLNVSRHWHGTPAAHPVFDRYEGDAMLLCAHSTLVEKEDSGADGISFAATGLDLAALTPTGPELRLLAEANGHGRLYLDLAEVQFLTGAALGTIVALHRLVSEAGGELAIRNLNAFLYEQFQITRLDTVLTIWPK